MGRYGALERVWFCSQTDREMFRLPEGVWIMFAFFQDCRDAQAVSRDAAVVVLLLSCNRDSVTITSTVLSSPECQTRFGLEWLTAALSLRRRSFVVVQAFHVVISCLHRQAIDEFLTTTPFSWATSPHTSTNICCVVPSAPMDVSEMLRS